MGNFFRALMCIALLVVSAGNSHAQENPVTPGTTEPDWIPYNGKIENIDPGEYEIIFREVDSGCLSDTETFEINLLEQPVAPLVGIITHPTCTEPTGSVVLSGLPEGNWIINPGNIIGSGSTSTIIGLVAGQSYTFTVTASNNCISPPSIEVAIDPKPLTPAAPTAALNQSFCAGSLVEHLVAEYPAGTELRWYSIEDETALAPGTELATGTYYAAAVSPEGCESERVAVQVTVNPQITPELSIYTEDTLICEGESASFTAELSPSEINVSEYQWFVNNQEAGSNNATFTSSDLNNDDEVSCRVIIHGACLSDTTAFSNAISIKVIPQITFAVTDSITYGDTSGTVVLSGLETGKNYDYQLDDNNWQSYANSISGLEEGWHEIKVREEGIGCKSDTVGFTINLIDSITFDLNVLADVTILGGNDGSVSLANVAGGVGSSYTVSLNNNPPVSFTAPLTIDTLSAGTYTVQVFDEADNASALHAFEIGQPSTFTFIAHVAQNETTANAGDGIVVIDSIVANSSLTFEVSVDEGLTWFSIAQGDSISSLPADTLHFVLKTGTIYSDTLELIIDRGCDSISFEVVDNTNPCDETGTIILANLDSANEYEYLLLPEGEIAEDSSYVFIQGERYNTITIGTQIWLQRNLDITDGLSGIYPPNGEEVNVSTFGRLYTRDAAIRISNNISGWHIPLDEEWRTLDSYLNSSNNGGMLKETEYEYWNSPNSGATNESGFSGRGAGFRFNEGVFSHFQRYGCFMMYDQPNRDGVNFWLLSNDKSSLDGGFSPGIYAAVSVRLLKNSSVSSIRWINYNGFIDNIKQGNYTIQLREKNTLCSSSEIPFKISINKPLTVSSTSEDILYYGASNGQVTISKITGGADGNKHINFNDDPNHQYTYTVNSIDITGLSKGDYFVVATDLNGCSSDTLKFTITEPESFTFDARIAQHETIPFAQNGIIVIDSIYAAQTLSFEYTKDNRATWDAIEQGDSITSLTAGYYTIILRADGVESEPETFTIEQTCNSYTVSINDLTDCGDTIAFFNADGLDPNKQYEYLLIPKNREGKPIITLTGDNPLYWSLGKIFVDPGATAYDERDGDITESIVSSNNVDVNTLGSYEVTYNVADSDGNSAEEVVRVVNVEEVIEEVTIGTQTWKVKNLDIDDGLGGIYAYANNEANVATYGRLYTWGAAVRVANSVDGWHLPSDAEWTILTNYLGGLSVAGGKLKEVGTTHWLSPNEGATNETGFTALPGGSRTNGTFLNIGFYGDWWSATEYNATNAWYRYMSYVGSYVFRTYSSKELGFSVRLIKDYSHTPTITLLGDSSVTINVGDTYTDAGATATDTRYGDITSDIVVVSNVNTYVAGTYTVTYNITTEDGYSAEEVVRTVVVEEESSFTPEEVTIGTQTWMAVNLDIDDGLGGIYAYNNDEANVATYGRLYTWDAAMRVAASIDGWHLPSDAEWTSLTTYLGGLSVAGGKLKETGTTHWRSPNTSATNESGFTALPGGYRYPNGPFSSIGNNGYWWSATEYNAPNAWTRSMTRYSSNVYRANNNKEVGYSVRLIKD